MAHLSNQGRNALSSKANAQKATGNGGKFGHLAHQVDNKAHGALKRPADWSDAADIQNHLAAAGIEGEVTAVQPGDRHFDDNISEDRHLLFEDASGNLIGMGRNSVGTLVLSAAGVQDTEDYFTTELETGSDPAGAIKGFLEDQQDEDLFETNATDAIYNAGANDGYTFEIREAVLYDNAKAAIILDNEDGTGGTLTHDYATGKTAWEFEHSGPGSEDDVQIAIEDITKGTMTASELFIKYREDMDPAPDYDHFVPVDERELSDVERELQDAGAYGQIEFIDDRHRAHDQEINAEEQLLYTSPGGHQLTIGSTDFDAIQVALPDSLDTSHETRLTFDEGTPLAELVQSALASAVIDAHLQDAFSYPEDESFRDEIEIGFVDGKLNGSVLLSQEDGTRMRITHDGATGQTVVTDEHTGKRYDAETERAAIDSVLPIHYKNGTPYRASFSQALENALRNIQKDSDYNQYTANELGLGA